MKKSMAYWIQIHLILMLFTPVYLCIFSCEKAGKSETILSLNPDTISALSEHYIIAGALDTNMVVKLFNPPLTVALKQVGCWEMKGTLNLDIDDDGIFDFTFEQGDLNDTPYEICCPQPDDTTIIYDCWPSFSNYYDIITPENIELLADTNPIIESIYLTYIDTLNQGDTINLRTNWMHEDRYSFYNGNGPCVKGVCGYWQKIKKERYVGFRILGDEDFRYGWIRIGRSDALEIREIAYED